MAVLIEGFSVVVRRDRIDEVFPGGWDSFVATCPNQTLCADSFVARVGFMNSDDAARFSVGLELRGLTCPPAPEPDLVVVDQEHGFFTHCDWLELGSVEIGPNQRIRVGRFAGDLTKRVALPGQWEYERSLSKASGFIGQMIDQSGQINLVAESRGIDMRGPIYSASAYPEPRRRGFLAWIKRLFRPA